MEIKIVIPTYRRVDRLITHKCVPKAILCTTESEAQVYKEAFPLMEIDPHPDAVVGIALTRQWIYDRYGDVLMLDDDISEVCRLYATSGKSRIRRMTPDEVYEVIQWAGNTAHLCGCFLFGFNKSPSPIIYNPFKPIKLTGFVNGSAIGLLKGSRISFSPLVTGSIEDYYASGLNAYFHRRAFIDERFCFVQKETFKRPGGEAAFRTTESEREGTLFLRRQFGETISLKGTSYGGDAPGAKSVNQNPYGRTLTIPF